MQFYWTDPFPIPSEFVSTAFVSSYATVFTITPPRFDLPPIKPRKVVRPGPPKFLFLLIEGIYYNLDANLHTLCPY
jgi:hypothetical protein